MGWQLRLVLLALAALIAAACGGGSTSDTSGPSPTETSSGRDEPGPTETSPGRDAGISDTDVTVTSEDGILQVLIPAGSGPAGVTIESIDLTDAEVPAVGYELGPDGATFSEPVTLTFSLPAGDWINGDGVPLVLFVSDSEDVPPVTLSRDGDIVTVTADLDHFSSYYLFGPDRFVKLKPIELIVPKGGHAPSSVTISGEVDIYVNPVSAEWSIPQGFTASTPSRYEDRGPPETGTIADAWITCIPPGSGTGPLRVELELKSEDFSQAMNPVDWIANVWGGPKVATLYLGTFSNVHLDGWVHCGSTVLPEDVRVTGDVPADVPNISGAALIAAPGGDLDLVFSTESGEGTTTVDDPIVLIFEAERPDGNQIIFQCPNAVTGGCLFFEGPSFFSFTADSTTRVPAPGEPLTFRNVDLAFDPEGVLSLVVPTITEQREDSTIEPGIYPLTSIGAFIQTDDSSFKEWFWNPEEVASTLAD